MEPDEIGFEMSPGRINTLPSLKVGGSPAVAYLLRHRANVRTSLRKARMRENEHSQSFVPENSAKIVHRRLKLWRVHEHVIGNHDIELRVADSSEFRAGIHPKLDTRIVASGDFDHAVRQINSGHRGTPIGSLFGQIPG